MAGNASSISMSSALSPGGTNHDNCRQIPAGTVIAQTLLLRDRRNMPYTSASKANLYQKLSSDSLIQSSDQPLEALSQSHSEKATPVSLLGLEVGALTPQIGLLALVHALQVWCMAIGRLILALICRLILSFGPPIMRSWVSVWCFYYHVHCHDMTNPVTLAPERVLHYAAAGLVTAQPGGAVLAQCRQVSPWDFVMWCGKQNKSCSAMLRGAPGKHAHQHAEVRPTAGSHLEVVGHV